MIAFEEIWSLRKFEKHWIIIIYAYLILRIEIVFKESAVIKCFSNTTVVVHLYVGYALLITIITLSEVLHWIVLFYLRTHHFAFMKMCLDFVLSANWNKSNHVVSFTIAWLAEVYLNSFLRILLVCLYVELTITWILLFSLWNPLTHF